MTKRVCSAKTFSQVDNRDSKYALVSVFSPAISEVLQENGQKYLNPPSHGRFLQEDYRVSGVDRQLRDFCRPGKSN